MPAQREEIILRPHPLQPQHLSEDPAQNLFVQRGRGPAARAARGRARGGQRRAVQLAVRGQRQSVQHRDRRRQHVLRQPGRGMLARRLRQHAQILAVANGGNQVGRQPPLVPACPPGPSPPPGPPPGSRPAPPRSHRARSGTRGSSPAHRRARRTPAPRRRSTAPDPRSGTSARPGRRTGTPRTAPRSAPPGPGNRGPAAPRPCTAPRSPPPAPGTATHPAHNPGIRHRPPRSAALGRISPRQPRRHGPDRGLCRPVMIDHRRCPATDTSPATSAGRDRLPAQHQQPPGTSPPSGTPPGQRRQMRRHQLQVVNPTRGQVPSQPHAGRWPPARPTACSTPPVLKLVTDQRVHQVGDNGLQHRVPRRPPRPSPCGPAPTTSSSPARHG